ncbi:hypothetical protein FRZ40_11895 [Paraburkholderia azotifigens]|uniref:Uncharacterized protein n=1 Tax=Paraburkholderia azotifigens TaxID=2057004 RepID=A0A5C6VXJ0_9BURK|nr:hypothetical protein FRZ40_11895 [Paraburkholderia azotifigens]
MTSTGGVSPLSLLTFFAAAKKVSAAPHRGNANKPEANADASEKKKDIKSTTRTATCKSTTTKAKPAPQRQKTPFPPSMFCPSGRYTKCSVNLAVLTRCPLRRLSG